MRTALRRLSLLLAVVIAFCSAQGAALAEPQDMGPATSRLTLEVGKGRLIRLDGVAKSVFIADPRIADVDVKSPSLVYVTAKAPGSTTLLAVDAHERLLANIEIATIYDEGQLRADLKLIVPNASIVVGTSGNALVLTGSAPSAAEADTAKTIALRFLPDAQHLIDRIAVDAPNQVNLRVRIAEVSRDVVKSFGFNWALAATPPSGLVGFQTGTGTFANPALANSAGDVALGTKSVLSSPVANSGNILLGFGTSNINIQLLIDAMETEGLVKVLAEPNLTALSGATATFLAGGEYPIPVPQTLGVTTIEYKDYGVGLTFVATITDGGRINLVVKPEVSQLSSQGAITLNGVTVPALTIRRVSTTVDLASGQSFALAGLLENNVNQTITKFPGLGNLPVLGALFRSDSFERDETELVIIVTPYLVRPISGAMAAPVDGYLAPTDAQRVFLGASYGTHRIDASQAGRSGAGLTGPGGFELE